MTNFEMLMSCESPEQFLRLWRKTLKSGCRQRTKEDWKKYCLSEEFRGERGCKACTIKYLNEEYRDEVD